MSDDFGRMIMRAGGSGGHQRGRRGPPPARPVFIAHPCVDWTPEHVQAHLRACQVGRDEAGAWDIDTSDPDQVWAYLWETLPTTRPDGGWGVWTPLIRTIEVP